MLLEDWVLSDCSLRAGCFYFQDGIKVRAVGAVTKVKPTNRSQKHHLNSMCVQILKKTTSTKSEWDLDGAPLRQRSNFTRQATTQADEVPKP